MPGLVPTRSGKRPAAGLRKKPGLQGPIDDALMSSFLFVRPTGAAWHSPVGNWAKSELERAQAQVAAASRTVEQAERVYDLTELRYREGLATQLDVSNARLALQQARINQVQAYHAAYTALAQAERMLGLPVERTTLP